MKILIINAGSSSIKYQLIDMTNESVIAGGLCDRIGIGGHIKHKNSSPSFYIFDTDMPFPTHSEAIAAVLAALTDPVHGVVKSMSEIYAVGHRVAHGGTECTKSCLIDDRTLSAIERCIPLSPLHNPANLMGIYACKDAMPGTPQIAVFDTAFHQTMPEKAYTYAIPLEYRMRDKVRRYGFHGTSHRYIADTVAKLMGRPASELKIISCHLGNGSSISAIEGGKSIDTTMGLTPLAGLPMGTRCGDLDPSAIEFIMKKENITLSEMMNILNKESGLLGISGISSDMRDIQAALVEDSDKLTPSEMMNLLNKKPNDATDLPSAECDFEALDAASVQNKEKRAALAVDMLCYSAAKFIGGYAAAMNGLDVVAFAGGIGENDYLVREIICSYFDYLGIKLDKKINNKRSSEDYFISTEDSRVKVAIIHTNEELVIARDALNLVLN